MLAWLLYRYMATLTDEQQKQHREQFINESRQKA
jgi:hypothetical protein